MKVRYIIIVFILFVFALNSCDKISPPYIESRNYCSGNKKILIEDYTGHGCANCPGAAVLAHDLKEQFCERVVIIGVHAGFFAKPNFEGNPLFAADFRTPAGNTWDTFFGNSIMGNPNGLIDRVKGPTSYVIYPQSWATTADTLLSEPAKALIIISNDFDDGNSTLSTTIKTTFQEDVPGTYKLIVCITQDNIIAPQKNNEPEIGPTPIIIDYVHNNVLRKTINGTWGEDLGNSGAVMMSVIYEKTYSQAFPDEWLPADCKVVAFVYNADTKRVLQAEELRVLD